MADSQPVVLTRDQADELISFLLSSAEITLKEPIHYGPLRLVDAVSRMIGFMEANGAVVDGDFLASLKDEIDIKKQWCMWDKPGFYDFLRQTPRTMAEYVTSQSEEPAE
ncbi:MAG TPA: DUF6092 family protein [Thermomicrobiales bacterium]|jgi:hypothetical protein|nr:DUF6092 family protein [Thermomicrobiales bacterium]